MLEVELERFTEAPGANLAREPRLSGLGSKSTVSAETLRACFFEPFVSLAFLVN